MSPTSLPPHPPSEYSSSPLSEEDVLVQLFRLISQGQSEQLRQQLELHVVVEVGAEREVEKDDDNNIILDECFSTKTPRLLEHRRQILLNSSYFKGHTLLTWAVSLGQRECVEVLLELGASPLVKTKQGWSPFNEATSYGDRQLMTRLYSARRDYWAQWFEEKGGKSMLQELSSSLSPELYLELSWQFQSWVPFVSNLCPSDNYKIYKKGNCLRIDTT